LLAALALVAGCGGVEASGPRVDSVRDGDTILLDDGARVRLVQVDAPELRVECWGDEAAAALARLVPAGAELRLERDPLLDDVDRHGRLLRYAHLDGVNVNLELVRLGAAAPYFYRGEHGHYAGELLAAGRAARDGQLGLWGACPRAVLRPSRAIEAGPG
jgi:endonuclease YncB( thermonuclease family)